MDWNSTFDRFRGSLRIAPAATPRKALPQLSPEDPHLSQEGEAPPAEPSWLNDARKLIPGEALAGYLSLQPIARAATSPDNVRLALALVFCAVTIALRWFGSQDPQAKTPSKTVQLGVIVISTLSYISLVYSTGGQLFPHTRIPDQDLYAQVLAAAIGILGPTLCRRMYRP